MKTAEQIVKELEPHCLSDRAKQLLADLVKQIKGDMAFIQTANCNKKMKL